MTNPDGNAFFGQRCGLIGSLFRECAVLGYSAVGMGNDRANVPSVRPPCSTQAKYIPMAEEFL
jgi:hypothetical protein